MSDSLTYAERELGAVAHMLPDKPTNKFTLATAQQRGDDGQTRIIVNIFGTDTGMAYGAIMDCQVFLGVDPRYTVQRAFQNPATALEYVKQFLGRIAESMHRTLELKEVDMTQGGLYMPNSGRTGKLVRH